MCPNLQELNLFVLERKFLKDIVPKDMNTNTSKHISTCVSCARKVKAILATYDFDEEIEKVAIALKKLEGDNEGAVEVQARLTPSLTQ